MADIKVYSLIIPLDELENYWMKRDLGFVFKDLNIVGMTPDPSGKGWHLLFRDTDSRKEAYYVIKKVYPESLVAFNVVVGYVDSKYLEDNERMIS